MKRAEPTKSAKHVMMALSVFALILAGCGKVDLGEDPKTASDSSKTPSSGLPKIIADLPTSITAGQCVPMILSVEDSAGGSILSPVQMSVDILGISSGEVFKDASCVLAQSIPVTLPANAASKILFIKPTLTQLYNIQLDELGQQALGGIFSVPVTGGIPTSEDLKLVLSGVSSFQAGLCKVYVVSLQNLSGVSRSRSSSTTINLAGNGSGSFHSTSNCSGGAVTSLNLAANTSMVSFSFKDTSAENLILTADTVTSGISSAFLTVEVTNSTTLAASQLSVVGSGSATALACSAPVQVKSLDSSGNSAAVLADVNFTLSGGLGFQAYADASCLTPLVAPKLLAGTSSMSFYYSTSGAGLLSIAADDGGAMTDASLNVNVGSGATGTATKIAISGPTNLTVGVCSSAFLAKTQDGSNLDYAVSSLTTVNLTGKGSGDFYSDGTCSTPISSLLFAAGDHTKSFYYKTGAVGALVFNADDPGPLVPGSLSVTISAGPVSQFAVAGPANINVGDCRAYVVSTQDAGGFSAPVSTATPVNLTGAASGNFYSDSACTTPTTSATINSGQSSSVFYYRASAGGSPTLSADNSGAYTTGTKVVTVAALPAVKLTLSRPTFKAGDCASVTVTLKDSLDGSVLASSPVSVTLSKTGSSGFFTAADCNGGSVTSSVTVSSGQSSASVYVQDLVAEAVTFGASSTGLSSDTWAYSVPANVPASLTLSGSASLAAGACVPYTIQVLDANSNPSPVTGSSLVTMSGAGSGRFSLAGDCSTTTSTLSLSSGSSQAAVYYLNNSAEGVTLQAAVSGLTSGTKAVTVNSGGAIKMAWSVSASSAAVGSCQTGTLQIQDSLNNPVVQGSNATINLSGLSSATFHTSADCSGGSVTSLMVLSGQSTVSFSFKNTVAESLSVAASSAGLTVANQSLVFNAGAPNKLILLGPASVVAGDCTAYDLRVEDSSSNLSPVTGSTTINFGGLSNAKFYSDSGCSTQVSSSVFSTGTSQRTLYLKDSAAEVLTINATGGALTAASKGVTVSALAGVRLAMTGAGSAAAGACTTITVTVQDPLGNAVVQGSNLTVNLLGAGSGSFYSDVGCSASVPSVQVDSGYSSQVFRYKSNAPESLNFIAQASGLTDATKSFAVSALAPTKLIWSGLSSVGAGVCAGFTVSVQDSLNNLTGPGVTKTVNLTGAGTGSYYSDSACTSLITSLNFASAQGSANVYFKASSAQSLTFSADDLGLPDLTAGTLSVSVVAGASSKLTFAGSGTAAAGACTMLTVAVQDVYGNPINVGSNTLVTLFGNGNGAFHSNVGCSAPITDVTIISGSSSATFYYKSNIPEALNFVGQGLGLTDASKTFNVSALAPTKLVLSGPASVGSGTCTAYNIAVQDTLNNLSAVGASHVVNLTGEGTGAFYTDSGCSVASSSLTLSSAQVSAQIYFKASGAQSLTFTLDDSGLPDLASSNLPVTVTSSGGGAVLALRISGSASINSNTCVPYAVMTVDGSNNSTNVTSNLTVAMAGGGATGTFYSDPTCSTSNSNVVISSGTSLSYVYYQNTAGQNLVFSATATGASTTTLPVTVVSAGAAGAASRLAWAGNSSVTAAACVPYIVSLEDVNGNSVNASSNTTVTLSGDGAGDFYTNSGCSTSASGSITISSGTSYTTVYFSDPTAQNLIFVAQSSGLSNATLSVTVSTAGGGANSGPPVKLAFIAQPSAMGTVNTNLATQPIVAVQDSNGNVVSSAANTITLAAYSNSTCTVLAGGTLIATTNPLPASGGLANYAGVNETNAQTIYLGASAAGLASACSTAVQIYPSVPSELAFSVHPSATATAGVNFATQPQVSVLNYTGQVMTSSTNSITIAAYSDSTCTTPATGTFNVTANGILPSSGVASFAGINYSVASTIYLKATATGLTSACSTGIVVSPAPAYQLSYYTAPPTSATADVGFIVQVTIKDAFGNTTPISDNIQLTGYATNNCSGGAIGGFSGGTSTAASLGTATYSSVAETVAGTLSIKATDLTNGAVLEACSNPINVGGGSATTLSFSVQPSSTAFTYSNLLQSPSVLVTDTYGNVVSNANNAVTLGAYTDASCTSAAGGTLLAATNPVSPNAGTAVFSAVSYNQMGTIYLKASSSGLTAACSTGISIIGAVSQIAAGSRHTCAIANSNVYCWGYNQYGQLGNGTTAASVNIPVQVTGVGGSGVLTGIVGVAAGRYHTCAVSGAGAVYCWGNNGSGQLGDNTTTDRTSPVQVVGVGAVGYLSGMNRIAIGSSSSGHSCAMNSAGEVYCWGYNGYGQLGDNTTTQRSSPVQVVGVSAVGYLSGVTAIAAGGTYGHTCAVGAGGAVHCWGYGGFGELGQNTASSSNSPVQVTGVGGVGNLLNIVALALGGTSGSAGHSCALSSTGDVYCWGYNVSGQLGDNTNTQRNAPVQVVGVGAVGYLSNIAAIAAGGGYTSNTGTTCAVSSSGAMYCWGRNDYGQLGDNSTSQRIAPVQVKGVGGTGNLSNIYTLAVSSSEGGYGHTCAVSTAGAVYCFGNNVYGQLGNGTSNVTFNQTPVQVWQPGSVVFYSISASNDHSCGVSGGAVYCWGYNAQGQLGDNTTTSRTTPVQVKGVGGVGYLNGIISVSVMGNRSSGNGHTCALSGAGIVYCWGYNYYGQLGDGTTTNRYAPIQVSGLSNVIKIAAGGVDSQRSCAVTADGAAYCWGYNTTYGALGDGTTTNRSTPTRVLGVGCTGNLSGVTDISVGGGNYGHTCAVANGGAYCWGNNDIYQLGDGTTTAKYCPVSVSTMTTGVTAISAGNSWSTHNGFTCAIKTGAAYCWGTMGNVSDGASLGSSPTLRWGSGVTGIAAGNGVIMALVNGSVQFYDSHGWYYGIQNATQLINVTQVSNNSGHTSTAYDTVCAIVNGGMVYCWGANNLYGMGNNSSTDSTIPWTISLPTPSDLAIASVAAGTNHTCAVGNGGVNCWGAGTNGSLGNGSTAQVSTTSSVMMSGGSNGLAAIAAVTAGDTHACALSSGGAVSCWGDNLFGDLGNNSTTQSSKAVQVVGEGGIGTLGNIISLSSGYHHNCAVQSTSGNVFCWGWDGHGQLGNNSTISAAVPTKVVGVGGSGYLSGFTKVVAGYAHSCGLKNSGEVFCWGNNQYGQLGNNTFTQSNTPVQVVSVSGSGTLTGVTALAAGKYHTCAISGGQVFCWGANDTYQLGNSLTAHSPYPQGTLNSGYVGLTGATSITAGANHSCVVTSSGGVMCWGMGSNGQLGSNSTLSQGVAMDVVGVGGTGLLANMATVSTGAMGTHTCALNTAGTNVYCWGSGGSGQMGTGATPSAQLTPVQSIVATVGISYFIAR